MIDINLIRNEKVSVIKNLNARGISAELIEQLAELDKQWRETTAELEDINKQKNETNTKIGQADAKEKKAIIANIAQVSKKEKELREQEKTLAEKRDAIWKTIPNLVMADVPKGGADDYEVIETVPETIAKPAFAQKDYLSLLPQLIDLERAGKVSGSRFVYLKGELARLELGLITFVMDRLNKEHFTPVFPPVLVKEEAMAGMGYLDHAGDEIYKTQDDLYLIGTSEQAIGAMHMNEVLPADQLPLRYVAFSTCFRREAGSHGKDVKGILRLHQFDKLEMFSFATPEQSSDEHEFLLSRQKDIMTALQLPYRVINLAAGDLGAPSAKTYDIETWIPSEGKYRETHSTSNTTDYQARRLNIRVKTKTGTITKVHMLNGTAVAISRILIALIENHQQADGSIAMPAALHPYLPFTSIQPA